MCSMDSFRGWSRGHHLSLHITSGERTAVAANDLPSELQVRHWCWCLHFVQNVTVHNAGLNSPKHHLVTTSPTDG